MTANLKLSMGGINVATAIMSLTASKEAVVDLIFDGNARVRLVSADVAMLSDMIANYLVAKHGDKKLEVHEVQPTESPDYQTKFQEFRETTGKLLQFLRR